MTPRNDDALTLPELINSLTEAIWQEVLNPSSKSGRYSNRQPMISSLRRNLQREYIANLIDLSQNAGYFGPPRAVQSLSEEWMVKLNDAINNVLNERDAKSLDDYTRAHLKECANRLDTAINAIQTYNGN